jgi:hypothetical protein
MVTQAKAQALRNFRVLPVCTCEATKQEAAFAREAQPRRMDQCNEFDFVAPAQRLGAGAAATNPEEPNKTRRDKEQTTKSDLTKRAA